MPLSIKGAKLVLRERERFVKSTVLDGLLQWRAMVTDLDQIQLTNAYYCPFCICYPAFYIIKLWYVICVHLRIDDYVLFCNFYSDIHLNKSIIVR